MRLLFDDLPCDLDAVIAFFEGDARRKAAVAGLAIKVGVEAFVAQLPFFEALCLSAAVLAAEFELGAVDVGRAEVGDEIVFEEHALIERVAVRRQNAAFERIAVPHPAQAFQTEIGVGCRAVLLLLGKVNADQLRKATQADLIALVVAVDRLFAVFLQIAVAAQKGNAAVMRKKLIVLHQGVDVRGAPGHQGAVPRKFRKGAADREKIPALGDVLVGEVGRLLDPAAEALFDARRHKAREVGDDIKIAVDLHRAELDDLIDKFVCGLAVSGVPLQVQNNIIHNYSRLISSMPLMSDRREMTPRR